MPSSSIAQYLTLGVDQERFGIDIGSVREILDMQAISRLPHAPPFLLGIIDVRGASYPVVDLRTKLGLPRQDPTNASRIIILDVPLGDRILGVGFVADRVYEVTGLAADSLKAPPEVGGQWNVRCVSGIGRKGDAFIFILDLAMIMAEDASALSGLRVAA